MRKRDTQQKRLLLVEDAFKDGNVCVNNCRTYSYHSLKVWATYLHRKRLPSFIMMQFHCIKNRHWAEICATCFWTACKRGRFCSGTLWWSGPRREAGFFWSLHRSEGGLQVSNQDHSLLGHPSCGRWQCPAGPGVGSPGGASARSRCCLPGLRSRCQRTLGGHALPLVPSWHISDKPLWSALSGCCLRSAGGWLGSFPCTAWLRPATACFPQTQPFLEC